MTTKSEFESYIAGFKAGLSGSAMVSLDQLNAILAMVPDVIASEVAAATPAPAEQTPVVEQTPAPVAVEPVIIQQPAPVASSPYISVPEVFEPVAELPAEQVPVEMPAEPAEEVLEPAQPVEEPDAVQQPDDATAI